MSNPGDGGGVLFTGIFEMKGGIISGNKANSRGGGIYNYGGSFFMSGNAVIGDISPPIQRQAGFSVFLRPHFSLLL